MAKQTKKARKFKSSGELKRKIETRHKHQKVKKQITNSKTKKSKGRGAFTSNASGKKLKEDPEKISDEEEEDSDEDVTSKKFQGMSVDDFLKGEFMQDDGNDDEDGDDPDGDDNDNESFGSVDDLEDEVGDHVTDLQALAKKDPEFYKYLQENDQELLNFEASAPLSVSDGSDDDNAGMDVDNVQGSSDETSEDNGAPRLTSNILKEWQKALLEHSSLRALRKLLVAFRSAANMNENDPESNSWTIDDPSVFNKLIVTSFKYTPVVLNQHIPYKTLPNGKFKAPAQSAKQKTLGKLVLSYFFNTLRIISQLSDPEMLALAIGESVKIIPYVASSRKAVKHYIKTCLELWSTADDHVRVAAFMALRKLTQSADSSVVDMIMKSIYPAFVRASKATSIHTIPSINLMKNSASDIYCVDEAMAYQHGFGYIRQLAVHLRNSMKVKSAEAYRQVYNWQFVHSVDFWSLVLAKACAEGPEKVEESELKPLIYPLVQITIGAIRLIPTSRYYPLHLHLIRSLLQIIRNTKTYIPLAPFILPMITSSISPTAKSKPSTLRPLDVTLHVRAPTQYLGTKSYNESITEEATFILTEWCESVQKSIAFPEIMVPVTMVLRRAAKKSKGGKAVVGIKTLIDRIDDGIKWVENQRSNVGFSPGMSKEVREWEGKVRLGDTPIGKWVAVQRKARDRKRDLLDKARKEEDAVIED